MSESRVIVDLLIKNNNEFSLSFVDGGISNLLEPGSIVKEILIKLIHEKDVHGLNAKNKGPDDEVIKDKIIGSVDKDILNKYRQGISKSLSTIEYKTLSSLEKETSKELVLKAIDVAIMNNAKKLGYIFKTLKDWEERGLKTTLDVDRHLEDWNKKNQKGHENNKMNYKKTSFNDYSQREYDYEDLEKKLLGLDNGESK